MPVKLSALQGIRRELCPRCRVGRIFCLPLWRGFLAMNEQCPVCGLKFDREPGYFLGAMFISYALTVPPVLLVTLAIWYLSGWPFNTVMLCTFLAFLPLVPMMTRLARVLWIYFDRTVDPG
jgi:uncharacterized protein (DUF983 family)